MKISTNESAELPARHPESQAEPAVVRAELTGVRLPIEQYKAQPGRRAPAAELEQANREAGGVSPPMDAPSRLLVVLDREYGEALRSVWPGLPVWIELSPTNEPVVHALWKEDSNLNHLSAITGLMFQPGVNPEDRLIAELDTIDLHHGAYSTSSPYTELTVEGCRLTGPIRVLLTEMGFTDFEDRLSSFVARRTPEQAAIRR